MTNPFEKPPEMIPNKEQVLEVISRFAENFTLVRELSDELGPYLIEVNVKDKESGDLIEYLYVRKGRFPNKVGTTETTIQITMYDGEMPVSGSTAANYDESTGQWTEIKQ
jgi:hypothetical protein